MAKSDKPRPLSPAQRAALESASAGGGVHWVKPNTRAWLAERKLLFAQGADYNVWHISSRGGAALDWGHYGEITAPDGSPFTIPSMTGGQETVETIGEAENKYVEVSALIWRDSIQADTYPSTPDPLFAERHELLTEVIQRTLRLDPPALHRRYKDAISAACQAIRERILERGEHPLIPAREAANDRPPARYLVAFDRIGNTHDIRPLTSNADSIEDLARHIHAYARFYGLETVFVDVERDLSGGHLHRLMGDNLGTFTITSLIPTHTAAKEDSPR